MPFTPEELEAMRLADEEIEAGFRITLEEIAETSKRDREAEGYKPDTTEQARDAKRVYNQAYYDANVARYRENAKRWREANREQVREQYRKYYAEHYAEHKDEINAKRRERAAKKRAELAAQALAGETGETNDR